jgi:general stress protein 26
MQRVEGLEEVFQNTKEVFLTTFDKNGNENSRPMTNYNKDPYSMMWFPTENGTRKVKDIENNPRVLITLPSKEFGKFFEIEGRAEFEDPEVVKQKWEWWYLSWRPGQRRRFWFPGTMDDPKRMIINIYPKLIRIIDTRKE